MSRRFFRGLDQSYHFFCTDMFPLIGCSMWSPAFTTSTKFYYHIFQNSRSNVNGNAFIDIVLHLLFLFRFLICILLDFTFHYFLLWSSVFIFAFKALTERYRGSPRKVKKKIRQKFMMKYCACILFTKFIMSQNASCVIMNPQFF